MVTARVDDLFPDVQNPESIRVLNDRCLLRIEDRHCVVIVSGVVLAQYALSDRMAEAYAMVSLIEQGWADQNDVARAFRCSARTVRRHQRRFESGGLAALGQGRGFPKGRRRLRAARTQWIERLKADGHSNCEIARRVGVSEMAIRKILRLLGWRPTVSEPNQLPLAQGTASNPKLSAFGVTRRLAGDRRRGAGCGPKPVRCCAELPIEPCGEPRQQSD